MDTCICLGCSSSSLKAAKTNASVHSTHIAPHPPTHPRKTLLINTLSTTLPPPPNFTSLDTPTLPPMPTHCSTFQRDSPKPYLHVLSNMIVSNKKPAARPPNTKNPAASHPPPPLSCRAACSPKPYSSVSINRHCQRHLLARRHPFHQTKTQLPSLCPQPLLSQKHSRKPYSSVSIDIVATSRTPPAP